MSTTSRRRPDLGRDSDRRLPLDLVRDAFGRLATAAVPLSIDGHRFPGLPDRTVAMAEVRNLLLRRECPLATRDAVWAHLVERARTDQDPWLVACCGMALPALASVCGWMGNRFPDHPYDVHAEVLSGFLAGLAAVDTARPGIAIRLRWAAFRAGHAALCEALDAPLPVVPEAEEAPVTAVPCGHRDLVLARAVRWGVLSRTEADLIGTTRLDRVRIADWARTHDRTVAAVYKARRRAELRLASFLRDSVSTAESDDPVAAQVLSELPPDSATDLGNGSHRQPFSSRSVALDASTHESPSGSSPNAMSKSPGPAGLPPHRGTPSTRPRIHPEADRCA